jgi:uncharacterized repeat protein (TIGR02543 family)
LAAPRTAHGYCYDHSLFIADRNLTNNLTYNSLQYGWTHGNGNTLDNGNYQMRMPTGGYDVTNGSSGQFPSSNEWDQIIRKSGTTDNAAGWIKNWKDNYSYVQDIYYYGNSSSYNIETRGNTSALSGTGYYYNSSNASYGYRPVLEVLNPAAVKTNGGLKAVTLDLNGGTFNGSTDDIKVVCAGASFTAPSFTGLTRPANSTTFGFHWNTAKDGTGTAYEAGDTVPNTVTKLYAQWTTDDSAEEQFTLATGKTYYFDLSGTKLNSTGGTTNTKLPDTSLRYVPFTYTGTVDAYALKSAANGVLASSETASRSTDSGTSVGYRYKHSLFVADYTVRTGVSWDSLNQNSLIFGTAYDTNYTLRALSGGSQGTRITDGTMGVIGTGTSGWPVANEWDQIISKSGSTSSSDGWIKNWSGIYTWVQDTYYNNTSNRTLRGNQSATAVDNASYGSGYNYLPALEVLNASTLGEDGLKAVTLDLNGGKFNGSTDSIQVVCAGDSFTAPSGQSLTRPTNVTTAGFHWNTEKDGNLTITLDPNGGKFGESTESVDKTGTIGQPIDYTIPAKTGYAFVGWAETADASEGNMFPTYTVALNGKTLYAVWKANTVSTAFFAMGGSGNAVLTGNIGSKAAVPADPERTGYTFVGWFTEQNGSGTKLGAAAGEDIAFAADTPAAYYANWTANTYTVTLNLNGGNIGGGTATVTCDGAYGAPVNCTEPVLDGYTFSGWKAGEADAVTKFITFPANNDTVYTAQWQVNTVTVTFNPMNGESTTVLTGNSGADMTVPANPERTGYTFDGWSLQPVSTDYKVPAGTFPTSSTAYYAQWTAKKVTVTMKLGEGTVNDKKDDVPLTGSYGAVVAYTVPTRSGYTFSGWKPEGGKDEDAVLYLTYPLDDAVYEAVWKAIPAGGGGAAAGGTIGGTLVTVPVSSDEGNTHAAVSVKDGTATVSATDEQIKEVISGTKETGTVVVDISNLSVSSAIVPAAIISAAQTAEGSTGLTVSLPTGSVTLDKTALDSTGGNDVKIEVQPVDTSDLNDAQKEKLGEQAGSATVIDVSVYVNNVLTHTFNDGKVDVSVPYTLKPGESADSITVWYLADDGSITPMHGVYDPASGTVSFTTTHLSSYVIASFPFTDVSEDAWYYGSAAYVYTHGIFAGTADTTFSPEQAMTRGMIVTVLWRMAGKPSASGASAFQDVASGAYYAQAVAWAAENGIVLGYGNGNYGPDDSITREQMAVILYRYAKYKGYDVSVGEETNILSFEDFSEVSEYAIPALQWACGAELIQGSGNKLMPRDGAVRAQAAEIFTRLCRNIAK